MGADNAAWWGAELPRLTQPYQQLYTMRDKPLIEGAHLSGDPLKYSSFHQTRSHHINFAKESNWTLVHQRSLNTSRLGHLVVNRRGELAKFIIEPLIWNDR